MQHTIHQALSICLLMFNVWWYGLFYFSLIFNLKNYFLEGIISLILVIIIFLRLKLI